LATFDTLIDTLLDGRYRVIRKLGTGGMASVYLAEDQELGRRVAIKLLDERHAQDDQFIERFRREAESAAGLSHANVVSIYDRGEAEGTYYIVMEYLEGKTLKELLVSRGPTPVRVAIDYTRQILSALEFAHRHGIVHRDIKPHNVVVAPDGRLKVTDFGIARSGSSQMTEAGSIIGTAQYLSPEQAQGKPVHPSSDLYSVGIVLYEMLTGTVPFTGETALEVAMKHLNTIPEPPSEKRPPGIGEVPHELDLVVLRALAKDPADRYETAREMDADLGRVAQGLPVAHETEEAATAVLTGAGLEAVTQVVPSASRGAAGARVPPPRGRYYDYEGATPRRPVWPWLLAALLLGLAAVAGYFVYREVDHRLAGPASVQVPFVQGITERLARDKIASAGLHPVIVRRPSEKVPIGIVFDQNPQGGNKTSKGDQVVLTVSLGRPKVEVPDVRQDSLADAVHTLTQQGLNYKEYDINSSQTPGTVTGQSPPPGTEVVKGTTVRINVSKGLPPVIIPSDVIGKSQADATSELQQLGFNVATQPVDSTKAKDTVVDTNPGPGTSVQRGTQVTLLVSKGPQTAFVPDVRGFAVALAVQTIRAAGFKAVVTQQDVTDQAQDSIVLTESPEQNTQATLGTPVTITIGHYVPAPVTGPTGPSGLTGAAGPSGPAGVTP
jgi:beta-lactam-binding protein with PASTA domain/predicted Ser/Thr protein kinase